MRLFDAGALAGPVAVPNSQLYSTAQSRDQAALLYALAAKIVRMSPRLSNAVVCKDATKALVCPGKATTYRALSAEASTAYGLSPAFVVHDELGVVRGPRSELFEALETAGSANLQPLSIIISTQATTDADLLSVLIDDALAGHDPHTLCALYTAPPRRPVPIPSPLRPSKRPIRRSAFFKIPTRSCKWRKARAACRPARRPSETSYSISELKRHRRSSCLPSGKRAPARRAISPAAMCSPVSICRKRET